MSKGAAQSIPLQHLPQSGVMRSPSPPGPSQQLTRRAGGHPLYSLLAGLLSAQIRTGSLAAGTRLPSEKALGERHGVSRQTVRQALKVLRDRGMVSSHPGLGTLVRQRDQVRQPFEPVSSVGDLLQFMAGTEMHFVSRRQVSASRKLAAKIDCQPGERLSELCCLRMAPGNPLPLGFVKVYSPIRYAVAQITAPVFSAPTYQSIERMFGLSVAEVRQDICAALLDKTVASALQAPPGEAALLVKRFYYDAQAKLVQVALSYFPGSRYCQSSRFQIQAADAADPPR